MGALRTQRESLQRREPRKREHQQHKQKASKASTAELLELGTTTSKRTRTLLAENQQLHQMLQDVREKASGLALQLARLQASHEALEAEHASACATLRTLDTEVATLRRELAKAQRSAHSQHHQDQLQQLQQGQEASAPAAALPPVVPEVSMICVATAAAAAAAVAAASEPCSPQTPQAPQPTAGAVPAQAAAEAAAGAPQAQWQQGMDPVLELELLLLRAQAQAQREARLHALGCTPGPASGPLGTLLPQGGAPAAAHLSTQQQLQAGQWPGHASSSGHSNGCWLEPELAALRAAGCVGQGGYSEVFALPPRLAAAGPAGASSGSGSGSGSGVTSASGDCTTSADVSRPGSADGHSCNSGGSNSGGGSCNSGRFVVKVSEPLELPLAALKLLRPHWNSSSGSGPASNGMVAAAAGVPAASTGAAACRGPSQPGAPPGMMQHLSAPTRSSSGGGEDREAAARVLSQLQVALNDLLPASLPEHATRGLARPLHWYWRLDADAGCDGGVAASNSSGSSTAEAYDLGAVRPAQVAHGQVCHSSPVRAAATQGHQGQLQLQEAAVASQPPQRTAQRAGPSTATAAVRLYTVWERMDCDLERYLAGEGGGAYAPMSAREAAGVAGAVASALAGLHALGALHLDVRPANVLLRLGSDGRIAGAQLADPGLMTWLPRGAPCVAVSQPGSWQTRSPEQHMHGMAGTCSDVWQLGLLLSALLTGRPHPRCHQGTPHLMPGCAPADTAAAAAGSGMGMGAAGEGGAAVKGLGQVAVFAPEGLNDRATYMLMDDLVPSHLLQEPAPPSPSDTDQGQDSNGSSRAGSDSGDGAAAAAAAYQSRRAAHVMAHLARACLSHSVSERPSAAQAASALRWLLDGM